MSEACFVASVDLSLAQKLKSDLEQMGFVLTTPQYTVFSAQKKGVSCTLYSSGKLTVQGKDKDDFILNYLEPEILNTFTYAYPELGVDMQARIGIDEAGKGDFFGPLCIAGVQAAGEEKVKELLNLGVKDSKKLGDAAVLKMAKKIKETFPTSVVRIFPKTYNELYSKFKNLNRLLAWGHATAIEELVKKTGCKEVIIDKFGGEHLVIQAVAKKGIAIDLTQRVRAEEDVVVAAASILARAAFLEGLERLSRTFDTPLPKGANHGIVQAANAFVAKHGKEMLHEVAKLHFKTTEQIGL